MAIHYVLGAEGSGTTEWIYQSMLNMSEAYPDRKILYLVPDQATLQAQKDLVSLQKNGCVMNIDILSFSRLKYRLSEELGDCFPTVLDDIGKSMILKKVLIQHDKELKLYKDKHKKPGFVSEMKSLLSELQRYLIDADRLGEVSKEVDDSILSDKLSDVSCVLRNFRELLGDRFLTEEDIYSAMCMPIERSEKLKHTYIYMNGFTGFTPSQYLLLRSLLRVCDEMTLALTMDADLYGQFIPASSIFHMTSQTMADLKKIADEEGIPVDSDPVLFANPKGNGALGYLQNSLFRRNATVYFEQVDNVIIRSYPNRAEEIRALIAEIERLTRLEGCRYRDIAVICGDIPSYSQDLAEMTEAVGIPCYIDYKTQVMNNPLIDFIRSSLRVLTTDFRRDAVCHYMKNNIAGYDNKLTCILENYVLAKGVRGYSAYCKPFVYRYSTHHKDQLPEANEARETLLADLEPLKEAFSKAKTVSSYVQVLYDFMVRHSCFDNMKQLAERVGQSTHRNAQRKCNEYERIYEVVLGLLDNMNALLADVEVTLKEFAEILDAGFQELQISMIPAIKDCVMVGDVKRSRLNGIRHLFLLGVNEGCIPGKGSASAVFSDTEREKLAAKSLRLSELPKDSIPNEEFYIYLACAKPTDSLTITYRRLRDDGKENKPSYVVYRILNILPKLERGNEYTKQSLFYELASDNGRRSSLKAYLSESEILPFEKSILEWFLSEEGRKYAPWNPDFLAKARNNESCSESISAEVAEALYGQCLKGSVSMLEQYANCAFGCFLNYGLRLESRPEYEADSQDYGILMHEAAYRYAKTLAERGDSIGDVSDEEAETIMRDVIENMLTEDDYEIFRASRRNKYVAHCLENTLLFMANVWKKQLTSGRFVPKEFEKKFSFVSKEMELIGKIDRVDMYRDPDTNRTFIKIIDYKSSNKDKDYGKLYSGQQLQLPVYMNELVHTVEGAVPSAMLYSKMDDPYIYETSGNSYEERINTAKPTGFVLKDRDSICFLDGQFLTADDYTSPSIPVKVSKGVIENAIETDRMYALLSYADQKMKEEAIEVMEGNISHNPKQNGQNNSCGFCSYKDVCCSFMDRNKTPYVNVPAMKEEEFFEAIAKEDEK